MTFSMFLYLKERQKKAPALQSSRGLTRRATWDTALSNFSLLEDVNSKGNQSCTGQAWWHRPATLELRQDHHKFKASLSNWRPGLKCQSWRRM